MNNPDLSLDDKEFRKIWLKKKFASWDYHEELLAMHADYLSAMHAHWTRPEIQQEYPQFYQTMKSPVFVNFDKVPKPNTISRLEWNKRESVGWSDSIAYNFNRGLGDFGPPFDECAGMSQKDRSRLNGLVGLMLRHCTNIRRTVEKTWKTIALRQYCGRNTPDPSSGRKIG